MLVLLARPRAQRKPCQRIPLQGEDCPLDCALLPCMAWRIARDPSPLHDAGGHDATLADWRAYVLEHREHWHAGQDAPLTLDAWRHRERARIARSANVRNLQTCNTRHVKEWRVSEWIIGRNAPLATRIALRARKTLLPEMYAGTLLRDGMTQDATRVRAYDGKYLEHAAPLSALVAYNADRRGYFQVFDRFSTHGARIAANLSPVMFDTSHPEGRC